MTLVDTNILIYATFVDAPEHVPAREWFKRQLAESETGAVLCWPVIYSFVRLISSSRVFGSNAVSVHEAWSTASGFLDQPNVRVVSPGPGHAAIAAELSSTPGLRSDDVPDIEIAALAIEHGVPMATHDSGFRRFARLGVIDPIASAP